jgi:cytidine deaminase
MKDSVIKEAIAMRMRAVAPYSNYTVGAAVLTESGEIIGGCNVESSSYGLTCCAERIAIYNAISAGHIKFNALAIATYNGGKPCGACRQVIWDICGNIKIHIVDENGILVETTSLDLLPDAFGEYMLP